MGNVIQVTVYPKDNPSENAGMSNEKGLIPRLKLMEFYQVTASKFITTQRI